MDRVEVHSRVGNDGVLRLNVPMAGATAGRDVRVTIEPEQSLKTQEEWRAFILSTAGSWQGDFERPPQGEYEQREPLS